MGVDVASEAIREAPAQEELRPTCAVNLPRPLRTLTALLAVSVFQRKSSLRRHKFDVNQSQ
jgi:hypothetical protein